MTYDSDLDHHRKDYGSTQSDEHKHDLIDVIGDIGVWQFHVFLVLFSTFFYAGLHSLSYQFLFSSQAHWCASPYPQVDAVTWRHFGVPGTNQSHSECTFYDPGNLTWPQFQMEAWNRSIVPCDSWHFDRSVFGETIVSALNLVCDASNMASLSQSVFMLGFLLSAPIGGQAADIWGRRIGMQICLAILIPAQILAAFSRSLVLIIVSRFMTGFGVSGCVTIAYVMVAEVVSSKYLDVMGAAGQCGWTIAYMLLPPMAWALRNWMHLQFVLTGLTAMNIFLFFLVPESPRWLLTRGKGLEAQTIIIAACKKNGIYSEAKQKEIDHLVDAWTEVGPKSDVDVRSGNFLDQFRTPNIRKRTLSLYFIWLTVGFVYYGLSYQSGDLGGDPFLTVFLSALVELPAVGFTVFALRKLGRRNSILGELMLGGAACFMTIFVTSRLLWLKISVAMLGKLAITACSISLFIYTSELFPTVIRSIGMGCSNNFASAGSIIAPFVRQLEDVTSAAVPMAIFGAMSITSGFLSLVLPETKGRRVPDTIKEAESMYSC